MGGRLALIMFLLRARRSPGRTGKQSRQDHEHRLNIQFRCSPCSQKLFPVSLDGHGGFPNNNFMGNGHIKRSAGRSTVPLPRHRGCTMALSWILAGLMTRE